MRGLALDRKAVPAVVQLLTEHPDLRPCFPVADEVDLAVRWGA